MASNKFLHQTPGFRLVTENPFNCLQEDSVEDSEQDPCKSKHPQNSSTQHASKDQSSSSFHYCIELNPQHQKAFVPAIENDDEQHPTTSLQQQRDSYQTFIPRSLENIKKSNRKKSLSQEDQVNDDDYHHDSKDPSSIKKDQGFIPTVSNQTEDEKKNKDECKDEKKGEEEDEDDYIDTQRRYMPRRQQPHRPETGIHAARTQRNTRYQYELYQGRKRVYDKQSGTGRGKETKKSGGGSHNWGNDIKRDFGLVENEKISPSPLEDDSTSDSEGKLTFSAKKNEKGAAPLTFEDIYNQQFEFITEQETHNGKMSYYGKTKKQRQEDDVKSHVHSHEDNQKTTAHTTAQTQAPNEPRSNRTKVPPDISDSIAFPLLKHN